MKIKYCPACGKEIPERWIKEHGLSSILPDTVGMTELHCFDCETDFEVTNKTVVNKSIKKYYEDLETNACSPLSDIIVHKK
jgi:hypothetical protein